MRTKVFISYAWGGESEEVATKIDSTLSKKGLDVVRDKNGGLNYRGLIKEFMEEIGKGNFVVVIISDKYLRSENCMFELIEIARNGDFTQRIFPIVLNDAYGIYKALDRIDYVNYWEKEIESLDKKMREVNSANLHGIREELDLYTEIRRKIAGLAGVLKNMNALTHEIHQNENFESIYRHIDEVIKAQKEVPKEDEPSSDFPLEPKFSSIGKGEKKNNGLTIVLVVVGILASVATIWAFINANFNTFEFTVQLVTDGQRKITKGKVKVDGGQDVLSEFIGQNGNSVFKKTHSKWLGDSVKISLLENDNFLLENPDSLYLLTENTSQIIVKLKARQSKKDTNNNIPRPVKIVSYFANNVNAHLGIICNVENKASSLLAGKVKNVMGNKGFAGSTTVVKPNFVSSGTFDKVLYGSFDILKKQNAAKAMKYLMLVKQGEVNSSSTEATCNFQISIIDIANGTEVFNDGRPITLKGDFSNKNPQPYLFSELTKYLGRQSFSLP